MNAKLKKLAYAATALAIGFGTFYNNDGVPLIYNKHNEKTNGLSLGIENTGTNEFTGAYIGSINEINEKLNGLSIGLLNKTYGELNGVSIGLVGNVSMGDKNQRNITRGLELGFIANLPEASTSNEFAQTVQGIQASVFANSAKAGSKGLQIGFYNQVVDNEGKAISVGYIFNWMNGYKPKPSNEVKN